MLARTRQVQHPWTHVPRARLPSIKWHIRATSGRVKPTSDRLYILAKALNVDPAWLLGYDVPMEQADTFAPTQSEIRMIRKFRTLDSYSKRTIEMMIDRECERNNTFKPVLMAAHNNETH